ncbi:MAG: hypothetical protein K6C95_07715 [Lachnospiraceae bacterium]|nr:hypothetical protein [Lachnospiraceae bacterium]
MTFFEYNEEMHIKAIRDEAFEEAAEQYASQLAEKDDQLAEKDDQLSEKDEEIARLKARLAKTDRIWRTFPDKKEGEDQQGFKMQGSSSKANL